jgi:competence CoiA-like predicted nuclease
MKKGKWVPSPYKRECDEYLFVAYDEKGNIVNVVEKKWSKEWLKKVREQSNFFCPVCSNEVELKIGSVIAAHFAHKKSTGCTIKTESESQYHMKGKLDLYEWLENQSMINDVQLEPYISEIKQRPDLLFRNGEKRITIEYQCSPIAPNILLKRSLNYKEQNIIDFWILGAKSLKRSGSYVFQLSTFQWMFARKIKLSDPPIIYLYCSDLKSFIIVHTIIPFSPRSVIANHLTFPIHSITYRELFNQHINKRKLQPAWIDKIKRFRMKAIGYKSKDAALLNIFLYQTRNLPLSYLPSLAFLPLNSNYLIESPVYVWQGWILVFIDLLPVKSTLTFHGVYHYIAKKVKEGTLSIRYLPFVDIHYSYAIKDYLLHLCQFSLLKQKQNNVFIKLRNIEWTARFENLLMNDRELMNKFNL